LTPAKLDAFVAVAEDGGFSAAMRRLHIGQSALSQTANAIERQFGLKLLERSSTGVRTTHQQPAKKALSAPTTATATQSL
jgi:DNA-binding transcriptional LysR family regulator